MKVIHIVLLAISFCFTSSQNTTDFMTIAKAILQNKNTLSDESNSLSKFAYWQGWNFNEHSLPKGIMLKNWKVSEKFNFLNFNLYLFVGNYTDQKEFLVRIVRDSKNYTLNQSNGTLIINKISLEIQDQDNKADHERYYAGGLYIYFVDKATMQPPKTYDINNLQAYTYQIRLETSRGTNFISSFFEDSYQVSQNDKVIFMFGMLIYLAASIGSMQTNKLETHKISGPSLLLLIFFQIYLMFYLAAWLFNMRFTSDLIYYLIAFGLLVFANCIKHFIELSQNGDHNLCFLCLFPIIILFMVLNPQYGLKIGDLSSCLFLLPQIIMKFNERYERRKHITSFEIGNWVCILLWVLYVDLYPNNIFLSSPKKPLVFIHFVVITVQLCVLVYLQFGVERKNPFQYTFAIQGAPEQEKLLSEQCAICIGDFEVNSPKKLYKTPCEHFFHSECLKEWGGQKLECPICRGKIPGFKSPPEKN